MANFNTNEAIEVERLSRNGFVSTSEASDFLSVADSTLRSRARKGMISKAKGSDNRAYYQIFFNSADMARRLEVSRRTIRRMAERGELTTRTIEGRTFYTDLV